MVLVSIVSAVDYFEAFWRKIDHASSRRRSAAFFQSRSKKKNAPAVN